MLGVSFAMVGNTVAATPTIGSVAVAPFHSTEYGYSVQVPIDWVQVPTDEVRTRGAKLAAQSTFATKTILDAAFQPSFLRHWFDYPHVSVTIVPYASVGVTTPSNDADVDALAHRLFNAEVASKFLDRHGVGAQVGHADFDPAAARVTVRSSVRSSRLGPVRIVTVAQFGRDAIVELSSSIIEDAWDKYGPTTQAMADSFRLDRDQLFPHAPAAPPKPQMNSSVAMGVIVGSAFVGAVVAVLVLFAVRRRRAERHDW